MFQNEMGLSQRVGNAFTELAKPCVSVPLTNVCSEVNYIYWKGGKYIPWLRS